MAVRREMVVPVVLFLVLGCCSVLLLQPVRAQKPAELQCAADDLIYTRVNDTPSTAPTGASSATAALNSFLLLNYPGLDRDDFQIRVSGANEVEVVHEADGQEAVDMVVHISKERGWYVSYLSACNRTLSDAAGSVLDATDDAVEEAEL